jgi:hypothetical protein
MKILFWIGLVALIAGAASLVVPIPREQGNSVAVGWLSVRVETRQWEKLPPVLTAMLILAGAAFMVAGRQNR